MIRNISIDEIKKILKKHESELKEKFGVKEIGVFGSYVRGEQKKVVILTFLLNFIQILKWT